ncbi:actin depolymerizing protein [Neocallimastix lanati (nom. inval.)]|jgi:hypothetical protein|uniref:Actin depolymerizing protein n=1 Tax=Neocallimastix californiae TaxID=1754190 RepID=A0A1Y2E5V9_9FUNG|nr:actin depolymerizing protein [Neocallimastix sp. JGI-2020a]ORY66899.1 actin depolymerizing protein [Neocallimastix californiae]|eukprot:ORY66899.1 actin depolymerizing protein [Neocallimastix californiae]
MSIQVKFDDENAVRKAIDDVHNDSSDITWCCVTHLNDDPNVLTLQSTGKGGVEEMLSALSDSKVQYCLYRSNLKVDLSETVKFTFIYNLGEKVSFFKKGRFGIVKGDAIHYFEPYHIDFEISNPNELNFDIIDKKLKEAAGVAIVEKNAANENIDAVPLRESVSELNTPVSAVPQNVSATHSSAPATPTIVAPTNNVGSVNNSISNLSKKFDSPPSERKEMKKQASFNKSLTRPHMSKSDEVKFDDSIIDGIAKVRNDNDPTTWVIGTYKDDDISKPVVLMASGTGDCNEMKEHFTPEKICYALIRVIDVYENINTVKFVFIYWLGSKVSVMKKAKISVHKGKVNEMFSNFHVDFMISSLNEISNEIVMRKVSQNSGSRKYAY